MTNSRLPFGAPDPATANSFVIWLSALVIAAVAALAKCRRCWTATRLASVFEPRVKRGAHHDGVPAQVSSVSYGAPIGWLSASAANSRSAGAGTR